MLINSKLNFLRSGSINNYFLPNYKEPYINKSVYFYFKNSILTVDNFTSF